MPSEPQAPKRKPVRAQPAETIPKYLWGIDRLYREDMEDLAAAAEEFGVTDLKVETEVAEYASIDQLAEQPRRSYRELKMYSLYPSLHIGCRGLNTYVRASRKIDRSDDLSTELVALLKRRQNKPMAIITNQYNLLGVFIVAGIMASIWSISPWTWPGLLFAVAMSVFVAGVVTAILWTRRKHVIVPKYESESTIKEWFRDPVFLAWGPMLISALLGALVAWYFASR